MKQSFLRLARALLLSGLAMNAAPLQAAWTEASSRHFVVISDDEPEQLRVFAEKLERFDQAVRYAGRLEDPDLGPSNRLTVYVVRDIATVEALAGFAAAGFYLARSTGSLAVVPRNTSTAAFTQSVLFHEYAHHLLLSNHPVVWPNWLTEGLAEFYGSAAVQKDGSVHIGLPPAERVFSLLGTQKNKTGSRLQNKGKKVPVPKLLSMGYSKQSDELQALYARGWLLVHYLSVEPKRRGQLDQYLAALQRGRDSAEAGTAAFGELAVLDDDLETYLQRDSFLYLAVPGDKLKVSAIKLRTLSRGEQEVMPYRIRSKAYRFKLGSDELNKQTESVREVAARFLEDAVVQSSLALAELDAGNPQAAEAAADRAIAIDPQLLEAHTNKALAQVAIARKAERPDPSVWVEVRKTLLAANRLDPDNPLPLYLFYYTFDLAHETPTANAIAALYQAREVAPQVTGLHLMAGYQYLVDAQIDPARKALSLYAFQPHSGETGAKIAAVLETLDKSGAAAAREAFVAAGLKYW